MDVTDLEHAKLRLEEFGSMMGLYNDLLVHDIGNYAGTAKAFVHLITDRATPEAKKDEMGKSAIAQLNRIDTLVDRISKLTKSQAKAQESLVRCDLADVLNEAVSIVQDGCDVELRKEYDSKGYAVHLGEFASDIFVNLLSNAVKYGAGRPVTIRVSDSPISGRPAWKASIIDEGTGVPDEKKGKLFERYARLHTMSQLRGQGLGLAIVRSLTRAYGGEAGVEDRVPGDHNERFDILRDIPEGRLGRTLRIRGDTGIASAQGRDRHGRRKVIEEPPQSGISAYPLLAPLGLARETVRGSPASGGGREVQDLSPEAEASGRAEEGRHVAHLPHKEDGGRRWPRPALRMDIHHDAEEPRRARGQLDH